MKQSPALSFVPSGLELYGLVFSCSSLLLATLKGRDQEGHHDSEEWEGFRTR